MSAALAPDFDEWWEDLESVSRILEDSYRHGNYVTEVFYREEDDTYWKVNYMVSGDGEENELREGGVEPYQVFKSIELVPTVFYTTKAE